MRRLLAPRRRGASLNVAVAAATGAEGTGLALSARGTFGAGGAAGAEAAAATFGDLDGAAEKREALLLMLPAIKQQLEPLNGTQAKRIVRVTRGLPSSPVQTASYFVRE